MRNKARRDAILSEVRVVREKAVEFSARFKDSEGPKLVRRQVLNRLDDIEQFWLHKDLPTLEMWDDLYLQSAERDLNWAATSLTELENQVNKFGGPDKVAFYPKS